MAPPLIRYGLDLTGINLDNFVSNEVHILDDRRNRAAATRYGAYFADSLIVTEKASGRILTRGIHYVPIELYQTISLMTGKDIFGALLVIDQDVTSPISISYNCVGGEYSRSAQPLIDLLNKTPDDRIEYSWYDILNKPKSFKPTEHIHPIGDIVGFQHLVHALEKIRNAILWTDTPMYQNLLDYVKAILDDLDDQMKYKMDSYMGPILVDFKRQLNKAFLGLGNVENLRLATEEEGRVAARPDTRVTNFAERKYAALSTIVSFKNVLYENFVSSDLTNIGKDRGVRKDPTKLNLLNLVNGAIISIVSRSEARASNTQFDADVYPTGSEDNDQFTIVKVTNNRQNRGGIFLAYQQQGRACYIGNHSTGQESEIITWRKFSFSDDLDNLSLKISNHLLDTNNPHKVTKTQVNLKEVENLPVVDRSEILCLDPVRKYVTFDALLLFMKTYMIGKTGGTEDTRNGEDGPLENVQILYCPTSNCNCDEQTPGVTYPPAGTKLSQGCEGFNLVGTYANGSGGTYKQVITANSTECGFTEPDFTPTLTGLNVTTSVSTNLNWVVVGGKPNTTFTHQYGLPGQQPITNTYTLNSTGSFAGVLNTGNSAGQIQSTFIFVNNFTIVQNTTIQANVAPTNEPVVNLNSVVLSTASNTILPDQSTTLTIDLVGMSNGRTYNIEYWFKRSTDQTFTRSLSQDIPPNYTATGNTGQFTMPLSNPAGISNGLYSAYIKVTDATNPANTINSNTINVTFVGVSTPPPTTNQPFPTSTSVIPTTSTAAPVALLNSATLTASRTILEINESSNLSLTTSITSPGRSYSVQLLGRIVGTTSWFPWVAATNYPRTITGNTAASFGIGTSGGSNTQTTAQWSETHSDTTLTTSTSMEVKAVITDSINSSNRVESNVITVVLRPPTVTAAPTQLSSVVGNGPNPNPLQPGQQGQTTYTVTGLIPGKTYETEFYAKFPNDANYNRIENQIAPQYRPISSFVATGNTFTFSVTHDNTNAVSASINYYLVVKQSDNATNRRQSNVLTVTSLGPVVTTTSAPQASYKQVTLKAWGSGATLGLAGVARQNNGELHFNVGMGMTGIDQIAFLKANPIQHWDNDPNIVSFYVEARFSTDLGSNNINSNRIISLQEWNEITEVRIIFEDRSGN